MRDALLLLAMMAAIATSPPAFARIQPKIVCIDAEMEFPVACDRVRMMTADLAGYLQCCMTQFFMPKIIVADEPTIRSYARDVLEEQGYVVA